MTVENGESQETLNKEPSDHLQNEYYRELEKFKDADEKLRYSINEMEKALAQEGSPDFRRFWDIRKFCLDFFKSKETSHALKSHLWTQYIELTQQARHLRKLFDEQSSFALEQIQLAVEALEKSVTDKTASLNFLTFSAFPKSLEKDKENLRRMQTELNLAHAQMNQIQSLRNEISSTKIRAKERSKLFKKLSLIGDIVFPKKKALVKEIGEIFRNGVKKLSESLEKTLKSEHKRTRDLREDVKAYQQLAKELALLPGDYNFTKKMLNEIWEKLKEIDAEVRKTHELNKDLYLKNLTVLLEKIQNFHQSYPEVSVSIEQIRQFLKEFQLSMKSYELGSEETKAIRRELENIKSLLNKKENDLEVQRKEKENFEKRKKEEEREQFSKLLEELISSIEEKTASFPDRFKEAIVNLNTLEVSEIERIALKYELDVIYNQFIGKKYQDVLKDSSNAEIENLEAYLDEKLDLHSSLKEYYEFVRKIASSSGLEIDKAIQINEILYNIKSLLEALEEEIYQIQEVLEVRTSD